MKKRLQRLLSLANMREDEIRLYMLLLKLRHASVPQLADIARVPVTTAYRAMHRLEDRGLARREAVNGKESQYFPLSLVSLVRELVSEQRQLRKMELSLRGLDPLLKYVDVDGASDEDEVEVREGLDAFREEYLKMPEVFREEYLHIGSAPNFWKSARMNYECPEERGFIKRRLARNLYARVLNTPSSQALEFQRNDSREKRTTVLTPSLPIRRDFLMIAEAQVSHFLCDPEHPRVIILRSPEAIAAHRNHFELLWKEQT